MITTCLAYCLMYFWWRRFIFFFRQYNNSRRLGEHKVHGCSRWYMVSHETHRRLMLKEIVVRIYRSMLSQHQKRILAYIYSPYFSCLLTLNCKEECLLDLFIIKMNIKICITKVTKCMGNLDYNNKVLWRWGLVL